MTFIEGPGYKPPLEDILVIDRGKLVWQGKADVPGMRKYENPYFLAAGDDAILGRLHRTVAA